VRWRGVERDAAAAECTFTLPEPPDNHPGDGYRERRHDRQHRGCRYQHRHRDEDHGADGTTGGAEELWKPLGAPSALLAGLPAVQGGSK
jgi:hypothetical protein